MMWAPNRPGLTSAHYINLNLNLMEIMLLKMTLVLDVGFWEDSQEDDNSQIHKEKRIITFLFSFLHIFSQKI